MLKDAIRHHAWATARLIEFCVDQEPDVLDAEAPGTYGPIKDTLAHVVGWDELLASSLEGGHPHGLPPPFTSLEDLLYRARSLRGRWERILESGPHPDRLVEHGGRLVRSGTVIAQALYHGGHHRSEVCTALSALEIEPPRLDAWAYPAEVVEPPEHRRWEPV